MEAAAFAADQIVVAVRVRPLNSRELAAKHKVGRVRVGRIGLVVRMEGSKTTLLGAVASKETLAFEERARLGSHVTEDRAFHFDFSLWSAVTGDAHHVGQEAVYRKLGPGLLDNAFAGYNACIFAYGQTGSGKTHTMMGPAGDPGLIPRICTAMFERIAAAASPGLTFKVECSYMEIYNERVRDLLAMDDGEGRSRPSLRVREHSVLGPYVDGLRTFAVNEYAAIAALIAEGTKARVTAATAMNDTSSRSHAVFAITITQSQYDSLSGNTGEKTSRVSLVDLAGSERVSRTGAEGDRLKEGGSINKSLHTLGLVIAGLADIASGKKAADGFVPYRDSVLTWLLKENLGGNSKTVMIANISPSADSYDESLSTLRYADCAKRIRTHAVVNEDANARLIRDLRDEVDRLKSMLSAANMGDVTVVNQDQLHELRERLAESERLMREKSISWEERLKMAQEALDERQRRLDEMGINVHGGGISVDSSKMYLLNLTHAGSELTVYYLKDTITLLGTAAGQHVCLAADSDEALLPAHCVVTLDQGQLSVVSAPGAVLAVDDIPVEDKTALTHGCTLRLGRGRLFRVFCPKSAVDKVQQRSAAAASDESEIDSLSSTAGSWGGSKFHVACEKGELALVQLLLKQGEDANSAQAKWSRAPIMLAADYGHLEVCRLLIRHGADPGRADERGYCPLHACCDTGHLPVVRLLVEAGASVNAAAAVGCTPLHRAADQGHVDIVNYLLERGADTNLADNKGWSALLLATMRGRVDICRLLLAHGADARVRTRFGESALHFAAHVASVAMVKLLLEHGADPAAEQVYRRTPFDYAAELSSFSLLNSRVDFLLQREEVCRLLYPLMTPAQQKDRSLHDRKTIVVATASSADTLPLPCTPPRLVTDQCVRPSRPENSVPVNGRSSAQPMTAQPPAGSNRVSSAGPRNEPARSASAAPSADISSGRITPSGAKPPTPRAGITVGVSSSTKPSRPVPAYAVPTIASARRTMVSPSENETRPVSSTRPSSAAAASGDAARKGSIAARNFQRAT